MNQDKHPEVNLVFMGRVVANYSHEIKNVLAIINETTGLMHDLITLKKENLSEHTQRFTQTLEDIEEHVLRGQELSTHLNALAHAPDKEVGEVDLVQGMHTVFELTRRLVRNKNLSVKTHPPEGKLLITTRPLEFLHLIFTALEWAMARSQPGAEIVFQPQGTEDGMHIEITGWTEHDGQEDEVSHRLQRLAAALQGSCIVQQKALVLSLPKEISA
jgi:hypothetical protein